MRALHVRHDCDYGRVLGDQFHWHEAVLGVPYCGKHNVQFMEFEAPRMKIVSGRVLCLGFSLFLDFYSCKTCRASAVVGMPYCEHCAVDVTCCEIRLFVRAATEGMCHPKSYVMCHPKPYSMCPPTRILCATELSCYAVTTHLVQK